MKSITPTSPRLLDEPSVKKALGVLRMAALLLLLAFVLLPMFWMVLTALKVPGTAFRLQFIPDRVAFAPLATEDPLPLPFIGPGEVVLHFELETQRALSVVAMVESRTGEVAPFPLRRVFPDRWIGAMGPLDATPAAYHFVVDGERVDPRPEWGAATEGGAIAIRPDATGFLALGDEPRIRAYREPGRTFVSVQSGEGENYRVAFDDERPRRLARVGPGEHSLAIEDTSAAAFRIVRDLSFAESIGTLYTLNNFRRIVANPNFNFARFFLNSLIVATSAAFLTVLFVTMAGYAFAVRPFHFREPLFNFLLASMLVPGMIYMVPQFSITLKLGWLNSFQGMVVPHLANVFGLFLLRQYILQIPRDLFNAAEIDGASDGQVFRRIVVPVCLPIMLTLFLLVFVGQWSNFLWQLIVNTGDVATMTLPVGLQQFRGQNATEWEAIMAGACFSIIPITILFLSLQKYFTEGLTAGAVKE